VQRRPIVSRFTLVVAAAVTLGCDGATRQERDARRPDVDAERAELAREFEAFAAAKRAAFRSLPVCPRPTGAATVPDSTWVWVPYGDVHLPPAFGRDSSGDRGYMHGGRHYRAGPRLVKIINGHFGWSSFAGADGGVGEVPGGCRARIDAQEYLVSRRSTDTGTHEVSAIPIADTLELRGGVWYEVVAPEPPLEFLLQILETRRAGRLTTR
jgi:hypothetical protein